jgi:hypothetical protein
MIFEGRVPSPAGPVVAFRDALEEATAAARAARGDAAPRAAAPVASASASMTTSTATPAPASDPQPQPFQPVDNPATTEPLPATP